jgi:hypothetical protein
VFVISDFTFYVWCEVWFLILKVLKNRLLRRICEPKRVKVVGDWRKVRDEELYNL